MSTKLNERAIAGMYHADEASKAVLQEIASMPRQAETLVEALEKRLKDIPRRNIVTVLKRLQDFGAGEFIEGRRGHPSRFRWLVDSVNVSTLDVAFPMSTPEEPASMVIEQAVTNSMLITHRYQLRAGLQVTLQLPSDLTESEAKRLSLFLQSLPIVA